jgi:hypothetical protein
MKVFLNRETVNGPYGGGNMFVKSFLELAPRFDVQVGTRLNQKYDAILLIDPRPDDVVGLGINDVLRYKLFQPKVKIFQRVNECDARKQTQGVDQMLAECGKNVDFTFFVSQWMREYHEKRNWPCVNSEVIYNGVDRNVFKPNKKFNNGKTNIVTSHWSDNIYKGYDVQKWLDEFVGKNSEKFTYTFIGRHQNDFKHTNHIQPLFGKKLGDELGKYDLSITGTRADPGPNHCLESIACEIPTYAHFQGGGAVEFVGESHVFSTVEQLESLLLTNEFKPNSLLITDWETCIKTYIDKMKEICNVGSV